MSSRTDRIVARLCHSVHLDALLGDLAELRARRARARGNSYALLRYWFDVAATLVWQSRLRRWTARQWSSAGALAAAIALAIGAPRAGPPAQPYTITAADAAGIFTLDMLRGRVVAATLDGRALPPERIVQRGDRLVLRGAAAVGDLEIEITPDGGIRWDGRDSVGGVVTQQAPIDLEWARAYFAEVDSVDVADAGALWGVRLAGPLLFVERASRSVVANTADASGLLSERDGVWVGRLPDGVGIANTAVEWAGRRWTMVVWPVPSNGYARRQLLLHESFHRIQPQLGLMLGNPANEHLASRDGRILTRLEWRALAEALIRTGAARVAAVEDALAFRAQRHVLFPAAPAEERALELNEGLAEYTGLRLSGLPEAARAVTAARELLRREGAENFTRSFAYASGPAYGTLLDAADSSWRSGVRDLDFQDLLRAAYGLPAPDGADAWSRAARYDGARVIAEETRAAESRAAEQARLLGAFVEGPTLTLPVGGEFGYSFDPNQVVPLDGHGTVYASAEVRDEWGRLIVESGGVLMLRRDQFITGVVVPAAPASDTPPTAGQGWRLELTEGWTVRPGERAGDWVVARDR